MTTGTVVCFGTANVQQLEFVLVDVHGCQELLRELLKQSYRDLRLPAHRDAAIAWFESAAFAEWMYAYNLDPCPFMERADEIANLALIRVGRASPNYGKKNKTFILSGTLS